MSPRTENGSKIFPSNLLYRPRKTFLSNKFYTSTSLLYPVEQSSKNKMNKWVRKKKKKKKREMGWMLFIYLNIFRHKKKLQGWKTVRKVEKLGNFIYFKPKILQNLHIYDEISWILKFVKHLRKYFFLRKFQRFSLIHFKTYFFIKGLWSDGGFGRMNKKEDDEKGWKEALCTSIERKLYRV